MSNSKQMHFRIREIAGGKQALQRELRIEIEHYRIEVALKGMPMKKTLGPDDIYTKITYQIQ